MLRRPVCQQHLNPRLERKNVIEESKILQESSADAKLRRQQLFGLLIFGTFTGATENDILFVECDVEATATVEEGKIAWIHCEGAEKSPVE